MHVLHMSPHCSGKGKGICTARKRVCYSVIQMDGPVMLLSIFGTSERVFTVIRRAIIADKLMRGLVMLVRCTEIEETFSTLGIWTWNSHINV